MVSPALISDTRSTAPHAAASRPATADSMKGIGARYRPQRSATVHSSTKATVVAAGGGREGHRHKAERKESLPKFVVEPVLGVADDGSVGVLGQKGLDELAEHLLLWSQAGVAVSQVSVKHEMGALPNRQHRRNRWEQRGSRWS